MSTLSNIFSFFIITFILTNIYFFIIALKDLILKKRKFNYKEKNDIFINIIILIILISFIEFCIFNINNILPDNLKLNNISNNFSSNLPVTLLSLSILLFFLYYIFISSFSLPDERPYYSLIILTLLSGVGNILIIFIINKILNESIEGYFINIVNQLYIFFILGVLLYAFCTMVVRKKVIQITNQIIYKKRCNIIDSILKSRYQKFEILEDGLVQSVLNNDTVVISNLVNNSIKGMNAVVIAIFCFIYLGFLNIYGVILSFFFIILASFLIYISNKSAKKWWEKNRDTQDTFFKYINDMINGFKELYINSKKNHEFGDDIKDNCKLFCETNIKGEFKFVSVAVISDLLFTLLIGTVILTFPIFINLKGPTLRSFVVVCLYMASGIKFINSIAPDMLKISISWKRINQFINKISSIKEDKNYISKINQKNNETNNNLHLKLENVEYQYKNQNDEHFKVGPINCEFKSGEIIFITGGNGSGKSTLAKLLTGLYSPYAGSIMINDEKMDSKNLGEYYSTIYSDFYLFEKLYGINSSNKQEDIKKYLEILQINDKVNIKDNFFNVIKLSTGQRKRLALLISYLEDKPIFLFDEWAADQDPEFRKFFYKNLLPELRNRGKMIIAITHDERYFNTADKIIKMEMGKILKKTNLKNKYFNKKGIINV